MKKSHNILWESLVGIIIWVFILSIVVLWVWRLLAYSNNLIARYNESVTLRLLKRNISNTVKNLDTSNLLENEIFYLFKDTTNKEYLIFTWSTNAWYKYIDNKWNNITDIISYPWDIYSQTLLVQREDTALGTKNQVVKASIRKLIKK